jgi:hypothetical protein
LLLDDNLRSRRHCPCGLEGTPKRYLVGNADAGSTRVQVLNRDGAVDRSETAQRILTVLLEQLR